MPLDDEQVERLRAYIAQLEDADERQRAYITELEATIRTLERMVEDTRLK